MLNCRSLNLWNCIQIYVPWVGKFVSSAPHLCPLCYRFRCNLKGISSNPKRKWTYHRIKDTMLAPKNGRSLVKYLDTARLVSLQPNEKHKKNDNAVMKILCLQINLFILWRSTCIRHYNLTRTCMGAVVCRQKWICEYVSE